jgi:hypothetical protein
MKRLALILIVGFILNTALSAQNAIKYPLNKGSVKYNLSMMGTQSDMTLYFVDNGNTQCTDVVMEMFGMKINSRTIIKGKKTYTLDMTQKTYTETELSDEDLAKVSSFFSEENMKQTEGVTKLNDEVLLDKNCQVYSVNKDGAESKVWAWKGLMLKTEMNSQGMVMSVVATSISESAPDNSLFEIPSDFTKKEQ